VRSLWKEREEKRGAFTLFARIALCIFPKVHTRIIKGRRAHLARAIHTRRERVTEREERNVFFFAFVFLFGKRRMDGLARTTTASVVASIRVVEQRCFFVFFVFFFVEDGDKNGRCAFSSKTPRRERRCKNDERLEEEEKRRKGLSRDDDRRRRVLRQRTTPERD